MAEQTLTQSPTPEPRWLMPLVDVFLVFLAFGLAYLLRYDLQVIRPVLDPTRADFMPYIPYAFVYAVLLYLNFLGNDLYKNVRGRAFSEEVTIIINGIGTATVILLAVFFLLQPLITSRLMLVYVAGFSITLLSLWRAFRRMILANYRARGIGVLRVLIVGMGESGQALLGTMISRRDYGFQVVGYLDENGRNADNESLGRVANLGGLEALTTVIRDQKVDMVVFALGWHYYDKMIELTRLAHKQNVEVRIVPDIYQLNMRRVQVENLDGIPLLGMTERPFKPSNRLYKRALDMSIALLTAPVWLLIIGMVALAIKLEDKNSNVFFRQTRVGENGRQFQMFKFRSMIPNADNIREQLIAKHGLDPKHPKLPDDPRITRIGRFIRRTSLDELPNLFNVLTGEMSLVGPRPPMPDEVQYYEDWHKQRLRIIPGMTGLWQVSGRSEIPFDEMCLMDIYYIENWSIRFDLQILLMTIPRVILRKGAF
jgi:exopolysaccharide biosynthesis polyprenyl glycosylphosphotransferase